MRLTRRNLYLSFILQLTLITAQTYSVDRVEPPDWWIGFEDHSLQLMVHGENISLLTPALNYPGVILQRVIRVNSPNYLFLNLVIESSAAAGSVTIDFSRNDRRLATIDYTLQDRTAGSAQRKGFDASDVIYLITPDRFANGNTRNDSQKQLKEKDKRKDLNGRHGGDIQGIINHLNYIDDMGFTALWLNPITESDQKRGSYHGYAATDFYRIDPRYGQLDDYIYLSDAAEKRGMGLIMDLVLNHCGSDHWWMEDLPMNDWLNYQGDIHQTNHRHTITLDPYASNVDRRLMTDGWFSKRMPDLNQRNEIMANYLTQMSIWWIEKAGLDGFRVDTYPYIDPDFLSDWTCRIMGEYPNFTIVGEEWTEIPSLIAHWQDGADTDSCLPSLMDFPLQAALVRALTEEDVQHGGWNVVYEQVGNDYLYADPQNLVIFADNHDMSRFFTQVGEDLQLFQAGMIFILTMRGIPQVFYGTEVLMSNPESNSHGEIRGDFPGGWKRDKVNAFTGSKLTEDQVGNQEFLRKLLNWRQDQPVIHFGKLMHYVPQDGMYVYFRYSDSSKVMVVLNKNKVDQDLRLSRFQQMLSGHSGGRNVLTGKTITFERTLAVPGGESLIIEID